MAGWTFSERAILAIERPSKYTMRTNSRCCGSKPCIARDNARFVKRRFCKFFYAGLLRGKLRALFHQRLE